MNDLISRQAAIDELKKHRMLYCDNTPDTFSRLSYAQKSRVDELDTAIATLVNLPSARPKGKWIRIGDNEMIQCSECLEEFDYLDGLCYLCHGQELPDYCPNCGAYMRGE